jgi:hypothetical protein
MDDLITRLRDYQESWADSIKRMDCGEFDTGIMGSIRAEQHATWKAAADTIERQAAEINDLREALKVRSKQIGVACDKHDLIHAIACGYCFKEQTALLKKCYEVLSNERYVSRYSHVVELLKELEDFEND